jgi:hypothetical protein
LRCVGRLAGQAVTATAGSKRTEKKKEATSGPTDKKLSKIEKIALGVCLRSANFEV